MPATKAARDFGFKPLVSLEEGLAETMEWWMAQS